MNTLHTLHIQRILQPIGERDATICGNRGSFGWSVGYYYQQIRTWPADSSLWCPVCVGLLTPMDELANTEL